MGKQVHQSILELNGQRFNAQTGTLISGVSAPLKSVVKPTMNDIAIPTHIPRSSTASKQVHKATQPGKTLMRHAVKKPSTITDHKTIAMDVVPQRPGQAATQVFHAVSPERGQRAESISKNNKVSRFGGELREVVTVMPKRPVIAAQLVAPLQLPIGQPEQHHQASSKANKMIEKGLRAAMSHDEKMPKDAKLHHRIGKKLGLGKRATSLSVFGIALTLIGGFFVYQNIPNLTVRYASTQAGINASLPTYQPSGFSINSHVAYSPGVISVAYKANADNRAYVVTQKTTNWNSDALKEHLMGTSGVIPQSYPDSGRTIYLHDNHEADWVNNGVWYSITGNSDLNTDQLIKIATSL